MAHSRPVLTHSTALMVSSTPKKAVIVGTLGQKLIDRKESMELMSSWTASLASTSLEHKTDWGRVWEAKPNCLTSSCWNSYCSYFCAGCRTTGLEYVHCHHILPKANSTVLATNRWLIVVLEHGHVEMENLTDTIKIMKPPNLIQTFLTIYATCSLATTTNNESETITSSS